MTTKIEITNWKCNGSIHPLIGSVDRLKQIAVGEYDEAVRWAAIHLDTYHKEYVKEHYPRVRSLFKDCGEWSSVPPHEMDRIVQTFMVFRNIPFWKNGPEIASGCRTTAQLLAKHGNTDCLAACNDFEDLVQCFCLTGQYNNFDPLKASKVFGRLGKLRRYYGAWNPNSGNELIDFKFGNEGSTVVYARLPGSKAMVISNREMTEADDFTPDDFKRMCVGVGRDSLADESDWVDGDGGWWRFWWD